MTSPQFEKAMEQYMRTLNSNLRGIHSEVQGIRAILLAVYTDGDIGDKDKKEDKKATTAVASPFEANHNRVKSFLAQERTTIKK